VAPASRLSTFFFNSCSTGLTYFCQAASRTAVRHKASPRGWGCDVLEQIVEVSIDLSGNYRGLVEKMLPNADIVADRFHVTKLLNQELNIARNAVLKVNEENQDKAEKEQFRST